MYCMTVPLFSSLRKVYVTGSWRHSLETNCVQLFGVYRQRQFYSLHTLHAIYVAGQFMKLAVVPKPYSYYLKLFDKATASIANTTDPEGFHPAITGTPHSVTLHLTSLPHSAWLHRHTSLYFTATLHFPSLSHYFIATPHSLTVTVHFFLLHSHTSLLHTSLLVHGPGIEPLPPLPTPPGGFLETMIFG